MTDQAFEARIARDLVALADEEILPFDARSIAELAVGSRAARGAPRFTIPALPRRWSIAIVLVLLLLAIAATVIVGGRPEAFPRLEGVPKLILEPIEPMPRARSGHAVVSLPDGRALLTGGADGWRQPGDEDPDCASCGPNMIAETFDPVTGSFEPFAELMLGRYRHTATILPDGGVLLVGGLGGDGLLSAVERYDPGSGRFAATGTLATARADHVAIPLPDGRILVIGGIIDPMGAPRALVPETFDPLTGTFTPGEPSQLLADAVTTTHLPDGTVLVLDRVVSAFADPAESRGVATYDPWTSVVKQRAVRTDDGTAESVFGTVRGSSLGPDGRVLFTLRDERNQDAWPGDDSGLYALAPETWTVSPVTTEIGRPIVGPVHITDGRVVVLTDDPAQCGPVTAWVIDPTGGEATSLGEAQGIGTCTTSPGVTLTALPHDEVLIAGGNTSGGPTTAAASIIRPERRR